MMRGEPAGIRDRAVCVIGVRGPILLGVLIVDDVYFGPIVITLNVGGG